MTGVTGSSIESNIFYLRVPILAVASHAEYISFWLNGSFYVIPREKRTEHWTCGYDAYYLCRILDAHGPTIARSDKSPPYSTRSRSRLSTGTRAMYRQRSAAYQPTCIHKNRETKTSQRPCNSRGQNHPQIVLESNTAMLHSNRSIK